MTGIFLSVKLQFFELTIAIAPFSIASLINFSPLIFCPLIAKKINPFLIFLLLLARPKILIFFWLFGRFLINFFSNMSVIKIFVIYG